MTRLLLLALMLSTIVLITLMVIQGDFPNLHLPDHPTEPKTITTTDQPKPMPTSSVTRPNERLIYQPFSMRTTSSTTTNRSSTVTLLPPLDYDPAITPSSERSRASIIQQRPRLILEFSEKGLHFGSPIFIRIFKATRELELWVQAPETATFTLFKTYRIAAYSGTLGPKISEGDHQAPEGFYYVPPRALNPNSRFHLSFNLGYPNRYDRVHNRTGSALMVHGKKVSIGCYAMTDSVIEEIYTIADAALGSGQRFFRVHIFPFRMNETNMRLNQNSPHFEFWENLFEGYQAFEDSRVPPNVRTVNKRYHFSSI